ncbi:MAG: N-acyl-D-amino-acid deacylase family protein [Kiritimatiellia bacterium]
MKKSSLMLDWKIINGTIIDGDGHPPRRADIGIANDRITAISETIDAPATRTFDADGQYVCPGFIDAHSHSDAFILIEPTAPSKIYQGVTTEITGNCGGSAAPIKQWEYLSPDWSAMTYPLGRWQTFAEYLNRLEQSRLAVNIVPLVGHGKLRQWVIGNAPRPATPAEIQEMCALLRECLQAGAAGMSTGLVYAPGRFAENDEVEALAQTLAAHDAIYTTHMRSEGEHLLESLDENIALARRTGVRMQISHLKTSGKKYWHLLDAALDKLRAARAEGLEIAADRYPYIASHTDLDIILPAWAVGGGREAIMQRLQTPSERQRILDELHAERPSSDWGHIIVAATANPDFRGRPLPEIATVIGADPVEAALRLIENDRLTTGAFFTGMSEENMWRILAEPYVMLGSDASLRAPTGPLGENHYHPRSYGTFPKFLKAALAGRTVALPEAVRKMTSLPAQHFRLMGRGRLAPGYLADITVFDPKELDDPADFHHPHQFARGIRLVMVNGAVTLDAKGITKERRGQILIRHRQK